MVTISANIPSSKITTLNVRIFQPFFLLLRPLKIRGNQTSSSCRRPESQVIFRQQTGKQAPGRCIRRREISEAVDHAASKQPPWSSLDAWYACPSPGCSEKMAWLRAKDLSWSRHLETSLRHHATLEGRWRIKAFDGIEAAGFQAVDDDACTHC